MSSHLEHVSDLKEGKCKSASIVYGMVGNDCIKFRFLFNVSIVVVPVVKPVRIWSESDLIQVTGIQCYEVWDFCINVQACLLQEMVLRGCESTLIPVKKFKEVIAPYSVDLSEFWKRCDAVDYAEHEPPKGIKGNFWHATRSW